MTAADDIDIDRVLSPTRQGNGVNTIDKIDRFYQSLANALDELGHRVYPPENQKQFTKKFTTGDLEDLLGIPGSSFRSASMQNKGPQPERLSNGQRRYSLEQVWELRKFLAEQRPRDALNLLPHRREGEHTQVIAAVNFKGGSSKTTTSIHLAHYLALHGYRVLAVDLDPQASLTYQYFGLTPEKDVEEQDTIYAAIRYDEERRPIQDIIRKTYFKGIDLIPSSLIVQEFEFDTPNVLKAKVHDRMGLFYERLDRAFSTVKDDYDIIIVDTPPTLGYLTLSALFASTGLIITVHPAMIDVASCSQFLKMMARLANVLENNGARFEHDFVKMLLTRYNPNDVPQIGTASLLRTLFQEDVLMKEALESTAISAAGIKKNSLYETDKNEINPETLKRALESMNSVNDEILKLIHEQWGRNNGS